jgi:hypothetical protein
MEIHAPDHPILTLKQALVHLSIVTVGILIALSLEGALEWSHHRALVREARENLRSEIRNNQKDIQIILKSLDATMPRFLRAIEVVADLSAPDHVNQAASLFQAGGPDSLLADYRIAWLNTASRMTAEVSGAFALMDYGEIRKYAEIYDAQAIFTRTQDRAMNDAMAAVTFNQDTLQKRSAGEIDDARRQLRQALGGFMAMKSMAATLDDRYSAALRESE